MIVVVFCEGDDYFDNDEVRSLFPFFGILGNIFC